MLLLYFAGLTAIGAPPEYRYRMILEPMLVVCLAQLLAPSARLGMRPQLPETTFENAPQP